MRTDKQIYQEIADVVSKTALADWREIIVSASIAEDSGTAQYECLDGMGQRTRFVPETRKQYEVYLAFKELRSMMRAAGHDWRSARMNLERTGHFRIEFDYESR
jgi:hypothetical protein